MSINTGSIYLLMGAKLSHIALYSTPSLFFESLHTRKICARSSIRLVMAVLYIAHWLRIAPHTINRA